VQQQQQQQQHNNNNDNNILTSSLVCFQGSCSGKLRSFLNEGVSRIFQEKICITGSSYSELLTLFL
jgi:transcriptional regulatory protein LevR